MRNNTKSCCQLLRSIILQKHTCTDSQSMLSRASSHQRVITTFANSVRILSAHTCYTAIHQCTVWLHPSWATMPSQQVLQALCNGSQPQIWLQPDLSLQGSKRLTGDEHMETVEEFCAAAQHCYTATHCYTVWLQPLLDCAGQQGEEADR